jgi:hypothetical protein
MTKENKRRYTTVCEPCAVLKHEVECAMSFKCMDKWIDFRSVHAIGNQELFWEHHIHNRRKN